MLTPKKKDPWFGSAKRVLFVYLLLSFLWIIVSDRLVSMYIVDRELNLAAQTYKGWFFVIVVGIFIYIEKSMHENKLKETAADFWKEEENEKIISLKEVIELVLRDEVRITKKMNIEVTGADEIEENVFFRGEPLTFLQIFRNIIHDAVINSPKNSRVNINSKVENDDVVVSIADERSEPLFFQTSEVNNKINKAKNNPDFRLGLYITRSLVENGGGRIKIESREGIGTKMYVQLPFIIINNGK